MHKDSPTLPNPSRKREGSPILLDTCSPLKKVKLEEEITQVPLPAHLPRSKKYLQIFLDSYYFFTLHSEHFLHEINSFEEPA